ncbi:hypothetical protein RUM43_011072 [Polyplax serrata]|uniref:XLR/SYCP3/FAM9 domain-containing protein n=1 Tax=Polyplax serrata TaxID=468196 RepID=A0AAN8S0S4_POLSC
MAPSPKRLFDIDINSLLMSDFLDEGSKEKCERPSAFDFPSCPKKIKIDRSKAPREAKDGKNNTKSGDKLNTGEDVTRLFESVGNGFTKSMQLKRNKLSQFTKNMSHIYQTKFTDLIKKHEIEADKFKKSAIENIRALFQKFEEEAEKLKNRETKLMKILEQQIKTMHRTSTVQKQWIEQLSEMHKNLIKDFEGLRSRQKSETLDLTKLISSDISNLQNNFLTDFQNEELKTIKKCLNDFYF